MSDPIQYRYPTNPSWKEICDWAQTSEGRAVLRGSIGFWEYGPEAGPNLRIFVDDAVSGFLTNKLRAQLEDDLSENPDGIVVRAVVWECHRRRPLSRYKRTNEML